MAEKRSATNDDLASSHPPSRNQHDGTTPLDDAPRDTEAEEEGSDPPDDEPQDHEYLSGARLILVLSGLTFAVFLMLLDASIVATVSPGPPSVP